MDIFISWSGNKSKKLAEILRDWFPVVIQAVKPYFTPDDIAKGTKWSTEISKQLEASQIGVICITPENYTEPWILFEAGALSKNLDKSRVCPILFGIEPADITGPLVQFQFTQFNKDDFKKLIETINVELGENKISDTTLDTIFETWWPKLEEQVKNELAKHKKTKNDDEAIKRSDRELLEELLTLVRNKFDNEEEKISPDATHDLIENFNDLVWVAKKLDNIEFLTILANMIRPIEYIVRRSGAGRNEINRLFKSFDQLRSYNIKKRITSKKNEPSLGEPEEEFDDK